MAAREIAEMAIILNCNPSEPLYWPLPLIRSLMVYRKMNGELEFHRRIISMFCYP